MSIREINEINDYISIFVKHSAYDQWRLYAEGQEGWDGEGLYLAKDAVDTVWKWNWAKLHKQNQIYYFKGERK